MTKHYSEADLLETYYTQPGESMPVMMHVAECSECAARYQRLDRKLREAAVCNTERPETFWSRQRIAIMRKIERHAAAARGAVRTGRVAAAALLALLLGAWTVFAQLPPGKWWRRPDIIQNLGLTEEQQDRLDAIFRGAANDLIDTKAEVDKSSIALRGELDKPQLDRNAIRAIAQRM